MMMMMMMMTMKAGVIVHERQNCYPVHILKRSDFHFSGSQRVPPALPGHPHHTVTVPRCRSVSAGVVVVAVQVGDMTVAVPPGTFDRHCTRVA